MSLIASTPATTADWACCATSCATRVTLAIGVCLRDVPEALRRGAVLLRDDVLVLADRLEPALREEDDAVERRFVDFRPPLEALRPDDPDRLDAALRERPDAPRDDADFALPDFLLFVLLLPALRDEALLDFPRDFLALVAIDASPRRRWYENHLDDSKNQAHP